MRKGLRKGLRKGAQITEQIHERDNKTVKNIEVTKSYQGKRPGPQGARFPTDTQKNAQKARENQAKHRSYQKLSNITKGYQNLPGQTDRAPGSKILNK